MTAAQDAQQVVDRKMDHSGPVVIIDDDDDGQSFECLVPIKFVCRPNERAEDGTRDWPEIESIWFTKIPILSSSSSKKETSAADRTRANNIESIRVSKKEDNSNSNKKSLSDAFKQVSFS